jgi:hypothetical protein
MTAPYARVTSNNVLNYMLRQPDQPLTVAAFIDFNWLGEEALEDLEGEDWCEVADFEQAVVELLGERM